MWRRMAAPPGRDDQSEGRRQDGLRRGAHGGRDRAGVHAVLLANETEAGPARPYSREKLCPILAFFVEEDEDTILRRICEVLAGEGAGHTFVLHAKDEAVVRRFALTVPVSRFLVNVPASLGGIGAETALFPALTLGCGAVGGSSSSNNIGRSTSSTSAAWRGETKSPNRRSPKRPRSLSRTARSSRA